MITSVNLPITMDSINKACERCMLGQINYYQYKLDQNYFGVIEKELLTSAVAFSFHERLGEILLKTKIKNVRFRPEILFVNNSSGEEIRNYQGFHTGKLASSYLLF